MWQFQYTLWKQNKKRSVYCKYRTCLYINCRCCQTAFNRFHKRQHLKTDHSTAYNYAVIYVYVRKRTYDFNRNYVNLGAHFNLKTVYACKRSVHFCFFFACGKKTYSQCEKTKNLERVPFSPFTSNTRYMCVAKK